MHSCKVFEVLAIIGCLTRISIVKCQTTTPRWTTTPWPTTSTSTSPPRPTPTPVWTTTFRMTPNPPPPTDGPTTGTPSSSPTPETTVQSSTTVQAGTAASTTSQSQTTTTEQLTPTTPPPQPPPTTTEPQCPSPPPPPPPFQLACNQLDIVFLMDSSSSINEEDPGNWDRLLSFVNSVVTHFIVGPNDIQFAAIKYTGVSTVEFKLNEYNTSADIRSHVLGMSYTDAGTNITGAIETARLKIFTGNHEDGDRANARNILVLITDGKDTSTEDTISEGIAAKAEGIYIISVGITDNVDPGLLTELSSTQSFFSVTDFERLDDTISNLTEATCDADRILCASNPCKNGATCLDFVSAFYCNCAPGHAGSLCDKDIDECLSNPCRNGGRCENLVNGFQCICPPGHQGTTCTSRLLNDPVVDDVDPSFGPLSGGSLITITGQDFIEPIEEVFLGSSLQYPCAISSSTSSSLTALTPPSMNTTMLPIYVKFAGLPVMDTGVGFQYKPDPTILAVYPLETIIDGGMVLTVDGTALDSVAMPVMEITMVIDTRLETSPGEQERSMTTNLFSSVCITGDSDVSGDKMFCPTPKLVVPEFLLSESQPQGNVTSRRKRSPSWRVLTAVEEPVFEHRRPRQKRQESDDGRIDFDVDGSSLTFYIGFMLDGVETYRNLSTAAELRQYSELTVYRTPTIEQRDPNDVITFRRGENLAIKGEGLTRGSTREAYEIEIGLGVCDIIDLADTSIICLPPQNAPEKRPENTQVYHIIRVHIGLNAKYNYGKMRYEPDDSLVVILAVFFPTVVALAVAVTVIAVIFRRRQANSQEQSSQYYDRDSVVNLGSVKTEDDEFETTSNGGYGRSSSDNVLVY